MIDLRDALEDYAGYLEAEAILYEGWGKAAKAKAYLNDAEAIRAILSDLSREPVRAEGDKGIVWTHDGGTMEVTPWEGGGWAGPTVYDDILEADFTDLFDAAYATPQDALLADIQQKVEALNGALKRLEESRS